MSPTTSPTTQQSRAAAVAATPSEAEIRRWLVGALAGQLKVDESVIDPALPFANYSIDSVAAVSLSGELADWLQVPVEPTVMWDHPTVDRLAGHMAERCRSVLTAPRI